jgi:hypothetical protein
LLRRREHDRQASVRCEGVRSEIEPEWEPVEELLRADIEMVDVVG